MISPNSPTIWDVHLNSWIIQDGNYPDFEVGQTPEFAVEFWLSDEAVVRGSEQEKSAQSTGRFLYDTTAEIVFHTTQVTILDIGILVYQESSTGDSPLSAVSAASRIEVQLGLGVDPFFYFERLNKIANVPPLVYSWKILNILRQTAPFVEQVAEAGALKDVQSAFETRGDSVMRRSSRPMRGMTTTDMRSICFVANSCRFHLNFQALLPPDASCDERGLAC